MNIPSYELQQRVFGYYTNEIPPPLSFKAEAYKLLNQGLTDEQIDKLAQSWKRMQEVTLCQIVNPLIEEQARRN